MPPPRRRARPDLLLAVGLALATALACAGQSVHRQPFASLDTPHFEIWSSLPEDETRALAHDLETFRAIAAEVTGVEFRRDRGRLQVLAFDDRTLERPFEQRGERSYFHSSLLAPTVVLRHGMAFRGDLEHQLLHDLVHFWVWSQGRPPQPPWRDEGFADLLSTARPEGSRVDVGDIRQDYLDALREHVWLPLESVLEQPDLVSFGSERRSRFRAQAWLFVHFTTFALKAGDPLAQSGPLLARPSLRASRYEHSLQQGLSPVEAFERAWGEPPQSVQHDLTRYARAKKYGIASAAVPADQRFRPGRTHPVPAHEAWLRLGNLLLEIGNWQEAEEYLERVREQAPDAGRAEAALALAHAQEQEFEHAQGHLERGLAAAPDDARVQLDAGRFHLRWADFARQQGEAALRTRELSRAREHLERSRQLDDEQAATWQALGLLEVETGGDLAAATSAFERAHVLAPYSLEVQLELARAYAATGRARDARTLAAAVASRSHDPDEISAATALFDQVAESATASNR